MDRRVRKAVPGLARPYPSRGGAADAGRVCTSGERGRLYRQSQSCKKIEQVTGLLQVCTSAGHCLAFRVYSQGGCNRPYRAWGRSTVSQPQPHAKEGT
jgi:hypothetical protein